MFNQDAVQFRVSTKSRLGPSRVSFCILSKRYLVLSVMINTAQFESIEVREQEGETEKMWP